MSKNICTVETEHSSRKIELTSPPDDNWFVYRVNTTYHPKHGEPIVYHGPVMSSNHEPALTVTWNAPP
jgi:hypothetical protein